MADAAHVEVIRQGVEAWNDWRMKEPSIEPDLGCTDLERAFLSGAILNKANLRRADLIEADLSGAHLSWADLRGANLSRANLHQGTSAGRSSAGRTYTGRTSTMRILGEADLSAAMRRAFCSASMLMARSPVSALRAWRETELAADLRRRCTSS